MNNQTLIDAYLNENGFEDLKDYEGKYKINREGKIWSVKSKKELSTSIDKGHKRIGLMMNGKQKQYRISELLEIQYGDKINEYIHHIDLTNFEDLKDFEGLYKINRNGDIWSCIYNKLMTPKINESGYLTLSLTNNGSRYKRFIHRLLAIQYVPNPNNLPETDHIDRNKLNNDLSNLRWCDRITNANNKNCSIANMTEEQQQKRIEDIREYKRVWNEKKNRAMGIQPKKKQEGSIYECVRTDNGKTYYKGVFRNKEGNLKQKSSADREEVEEWLKQIKEE